MEPRAGSRLHVLDVLRGIALLGTPEADKAHKLYDGGHVFPFSRMIKDSLDWLDRYLGVPR